MGRGPAQPGAVRLADSCLQLYRFLQYQLANVSVRRSLTQSPIDLDLRLRRDRLVRRQRVHREETRRMARESIGCDHAYPAIDAVFSARPTTGNEVRAQVEKLAQRIAMKEHREIERRPRFCGEIDGF